MSLRIRIGLPPLYLHGVVLSFFVPLRQTACSSVGGCTIFSGEVTGCVPHENGSRILYVIVWDLIQSFYVGLIIRYYFLVNCVGPSLSVWRHHHKRQQQKHVQFCCALLYLLTFPCRNCRSYLIITVTQGEETALANMPSRFGAWKLSLWRH
jgi:hypothetical protein